VSSSAAAIAAVVAAAVSVATVVVAEAAAAVAIAGLGLVVVAAGTTKAAGMILLQLLTVHWGQFEVPVVVTFLNSLRLVIILHVKFFVLKEYNIIISIKQD